MKSDHVAFGYRREVGAGSFCHEEPYDSEEQLLDMSEFYQTYLVNQGYGRSKLITDVAVTAATRFRIRPGAGELLQLAEGEDALIVPRLAFLGSWRKDLLETMALLHRRRLLIYCLDLLPAAQLDSGRLFLLAVEKEQDFEHLYRRHFAAQRQVGGGGKHDRRKVYQTWLRHKRQQEQAHFIVEVRDRYQWSWPRIVEWFRHCKLKPPREQWTVTTVQRIYQAAKRTTPTTP